MSDRCFRCHGTDARQRKKELRLDQRESALKVIKPGDPDGSKLIQRVFATDPEERMPPPDSHLELSAAEKEILRRWVAAGAEYRGHWAYQPIVAPEVPKAPALRGGRNEIDAFVAARLQSEGLEPQAEASPERLLRRLSFDLTGLPPTLDELDAFTAAAAQNHEAALAQEITRLLASPHFGERMAVDWLDVARFADTFGYQSDVAMNVWPYRDWVIKAFNENLPFDQFITWQLAGDLLPGATRDQQLATAFNRLHRQTNEGGSVEEEFRVEYNCDRVETFGLAFLGLTLQCAKCHDHKYDPITQRDYYSLFACFQNIDESGLYSHFTDAVPTPTLRLTSPRQNADLALAEAAIAQAEARLATMREDCRPAFVAWLETAPPEAELPIPGEIGRFSCDQLEDRKLKNEVNAKEPGSLFEDVTPDRREAWSGPAPERREQRELRARRHLHARRSVFNRALAEDTRCEVACGGVPPVKSLDRCRLEWLRIAHRRRPVERSPDSFLAGQRRACCHQGPDCRERVDSRALELRRVKPGARASPVRQRARSPGGRGARWLDQGHQPRRRNPPNVRPAIPRPRVQGRDGR